MANEESQGPQLPPAMPGVSISNQAMMVVAENLSARLAELNREKREIEAVLGEINNAMMLAAMQQRG